MFYRAAADAIASIHLLFVLFVVLGSLLVLKWRRLAWMHVPAVLWGAWIEFSGGICPLTPLENHLRMRGGEAGFAGDFIEHYLLKVIYPDGLTRTVQVVLGVVALAINLAVYWWMLSRPFDGAHFAKPAPRGERWRN